MNSSKDLIDIRVPKVIKIKPYRMSNVLVLLVPLVGTILIVPLKFKLPTVARFLHMTATGRAYWKLFDNREAIHSLAADCNTSIQFLLMAL